MKTILLSLVITCIVILLGIYFIPIAMFLLKVIIFLGIVIIFSLGFMLGRLTKKAEDKLKG